MNKKRIVTLFSALIAMVMIISVITSVIAGLQQQKGIETLMNQTTLSALSAMTSLTSALSPIF